MSSGGEQDLTKVISPNLMWKTVKKGPRSESRCTRKPAERKIKVDAELGSNISKDVCDSSIFESEKLGVVVPGDNFAEKIAGLPIKKRRHLFPTQLPPPRTPSLDQEGSLPHHPNALSSDQKEQLDVSKCSSGQRSSNTYAEKCANKNRLGIDGGVRSKSLEPTNKEIDGCEDFSGIALLAAVASSTDKDAGMKECSSVPDNALPVVLNLHCRNVNDSGEKSSPQKNVMFHWDLNKMMDEWEEPCFSLPPSSPRNVVEAIVGDGLHCQNLNPGGCRRKEFENSGCESKCVASDTEISSNKSDMTNIFVPLASHTSIVVGQDDAIGYSMGQGGDQGYSDYTTTNDIPETADSKKLAHMYYGKLVTEEADEDVFHSQKSCKGIDNDKLASEGPQSDVCGSEVFQDERRHLADGDIMIKVEGYESPYEEGELREAAVHAWDEKAVEDKENEHSHGDSQTTQDTSFLLQKNVYAVHGNDTIRHAEDVLNKPSSVMSLKACRSGNVGEPYFQTDREFGSEEVVGRERLPYQGCGRNEIDYQQADSEMRIWESRNPYANPRPRYVVGYSDGWASEFYNLDSYQSRRQSPTERNDSYGFHIRKQTSRGFSRDRSRGRSEFTPGVFRRGPKEKYHEPGSYYLERKEKGFSPSFSRDSHILRPRRRSRSRSRSSSPIAWNMNNRSARQRSPDVGPEGRLQGERLPFQKSSSSDDFRKHLVSPPRGCRLSHQHSSRCSDGRRSMDRQYRDRRLSPPARMFRRNSRFDSVGSTERLKSSSDYFKAVTPPGRFPQMLDASQSPHNYDQSSDDRRKPDETANRMSIELCNARDEDGCLAAPSSIKEESIPPEIHQEKLANIDAASSEQQVFDVNASTKEF